MQISVELQESFSYSVIPLLVLIIIVCILTYNIIHTKRDKTTKQNKIQIVKIPEKNIKNIPVIKNKYLEQLEDIENKYKSNKIELRKAYQMISSSIRMFIFEVTDIQTQNYTLEEIKKIDMPILYELVEEYYEPEFAAKSVGDFKEATNKARRIIEKWN